MSDRALTVEAVLAGLQDIRLPAGAPGGLVAELLVALGAGLLCALAFGLMLRAFTTVLEQKKRSPTLADRVQLAATLPEEQRQLQLMHMLKSTRPDAFAVVAGNLYRRDGLPDSKTLEKELLSHD